VVGLVRSQRPHDQNVLHKQRQQQRVKNYFEWGLDKIYLYMQYYAMTNTKPTKRMNHGSDVIDQIASECMLVRVRKLNRVLTGIYDAELRPFGLKASQLSLLVLVAKAGPIRRIEIGKILHLDPSTLTRNLKIMLTNGWIQEIADGEDGRGFPVQITVQGRDLVNQIGPSWRKAQTRTEKFLGGDGTTLLRMFAANKMELPSG
jgi:DNA-binding MarR family transcriptional regulator